MAKLSKSNDIKALAYSSTEPRIEDEVTFRCSVVYGVMDVEKLKAQGEVPSVWLTASSVNQYVSSFWKLEIENKILKRYIAQMRKHQQTILDRC